MVGEMHEMVVETRENATDGVRAHSSWSWDGEDLMLFMASCSNFES